MKHTVTINNNIINENNDDDDDDDDDNEEEEEEEFIIIYSIPLGGSSTLYAIIINYVYFGFIS